MIVIRKPSAPIRMARIIATVGAVTWAMAGSRACAPATRIACTAIVRAHPTMSASANSVGLAQTVPSIVAATIIRLVWNVWVNAISAKRGRKANVVSVVVRAAMAMRHRPMVVILVNAMVMAIRIWAFAMWAPASAIARTIQWV